MSSRKFLLLDTSAILGYYIPEAATNADAAARIRILIEATRHHRADLQLLVPNIVVAEVFCQLARLCYSTWDKQVNRTFGGKGKALDTRRYKSARDRFRRDIHNGGLLYQMDLGRYHILALDLIAPVDKHRKIYRSKNTKSMGTDDLLIGGMALHLVKTHGKDNFAVIANDRRMVSVFSKTSPNLNRMTAINLGLTSKSRELGFGEWCSDIYPQVLDLARCKDSDLKTFFEIWPLPTGKLRNVDPKA